MSSLLRSLALGLGGVVLALGAGCGDDDPGHSVPVGSSGAGGDVGLAGEASIHDGGRADGGATGDSGAAGETAGAGGAASGVVDGCEAPTGAGTDVPVAITADETWTFEGSPYRIASTTYLTATLTLEPCTVVELDQDVGILVGNTPEAGAIIAHGDSKQNAAGQTERREISFQRLTQDASWGSISVDTTGSLDFSLVRLSGGGSLASEQNGGGTIVAYGDNPQGEPTPSVSVQDVTIAGSETYAVNLTSRASFAAGSDGLTIETSGKESGYPIYVEAGAAFSLPTNLRLDGNERDEVLVHPFARVASDTLPSRGVPLVLDGELYIATPNDEPGLATLTIEAGTELKLGGPAAGITFGADATHQGTLKAVGTATAPIWFHSAESVPAAGDWLGLYFAHTTASGNRLEHAVIEDAGGFSGAKGFGCGPTTNDASILIFGDTAIEPFVKNCEIKHQAGDTQIMLGWSVSVDQAGEAQAFVDTNTFADAPTCRVSLPSQADAPACPGNDAEPDCL